MQLDIDIEAWPPPQSMAPDWDALAERAAEVVQHCSDCDILGTGHPLQNRLQALQHLLLLLMVTDSTER